MKYKVNAYFAVLCVTISGSLAAWVILNLAIDTALTEQLRGSEASYASLERSILRQ